MNKNDLKNGMFFEMRNKSRFLILNNEIYLEDINLYEYSSNLHYFLVSYNDDMRSMNDNEYDIMIVKDVDDNVIWERREIDWSKISVDTKVLVRNSKYGEWHRRYFAKYEDGWVYCFDNGANSWNSNEISLWKYCKLAEEPSDKVTIEELDNQFKKSCGRQNCCNCDYESIDRECEFLWLMDNYNVTRKE